MYAQKSYRFPAAHACMLALLASSCVDAAADEQSISTYEARQQTPTVGSPAVKQAPTIDLEGVPQGLSPFQTLGERDSQATHHQFHHRKKYVCSAGFDSPLVLLAENAELAHPAVGPFDDPATREDVEPLPIIAALHHLDAQARLCSNLVDDSSLIRAVNPDVLDGRICTCRLHQNRNGTISILDGGWRDLGHENQSEHVNEQVSLSTVYLFFPRRSPLDHRRQCT
jgi:hypothetical protein